MCGIAGIIQFEPTWQKEKIIQRLDVMSSSLSHRGPDDNGIWVSENNNIGFAHRRLSIIDLTKSGHQPMLSWDKRFCITFNGEIYNYKEIRQALEKCGSKFHTESDTEIIIEAYRVYGESCLDMFDGMFAFVLYDVESRKIMAARDPFGEKPFYYAWLGDVFVFGSELSAISSIPEFERSLSRDSLSKYLCLQYFEGEECVYQNANKLKPGHFMVLEKNKPVRITRYFEFSPVGAQKAVDVDALVDELDEILTRNIQRRLRADVPVGAFLSGGVDSSAIVAYATQKLNVDIQTFSIGFNNWHDSEHVDAEFMARHLGTQHTAQMLGSECLEMAGEIARLVDEPNGDSSLVPTYLLSQLARQSVKVVLSGDGADELFGGYGRYLTTIAEQNCGVSDSTLGERYYSNRILVFNDDELLQLMSNIPASVKSYFSTLRQELNSSNANLIDCLRKTDVEHYLPGAVLAKVDRMSMQHGLEVRTPFLNLEMAKFAEKLPPELIANGQAGKLLLKKLISRYIPKSFLDKPKRGFGLPGYRWGDGKLFDSTKSRLVANRNRTNGYLDNDKIERWFAKNESDKDSVNYKLWNLLHLDNFVKYNNVEISCEIDTLQLISLRQQIKGRVSSAAILAISANDKWVNSLDDQVTIIALWNKCTQSKIIESDWIEDISSALNDARKTSGHNITEIYFLHTNSREVSYHLVALKQQGIKTVFVYDEMMWKRLSINAELGGKSHKPVSKTLLPLVFDVIEKSPINYTLNNILSDLVNDIKSTFIQSNNNKSIDELFGKQKKGLFTVDTPKRTMALMSELKSWSIYHYNENKYLKKMEEIFQTNFIRQNIRSTSHKKVLFVLPTLSPGGAERQVCNMAGALLTQGYTVKVMTLYPTVGQAGHYLPLLEKQGVEVITGFTPDADISLAELEEELPIESLNLLMAPIPLIRKKIWPVFTNIYKYQPNAVICYLDMANTLAGIGALLAGVPRVVLSFRNINPTNFNFYESWFLKCYDILIKSPRVTLTGNSIVGNKDYADWLKIDAGNIFLFRNGIDFTQYVKPSDLDLDQTRNKIGLQENNVPVVGGVFRLAEEKRPQLFVEAFAIVKQKIKNAKGFIVGDGPLRQKIINQIIEKGLQNDLILAGCTDNVAKYFSIADVILQTSLAEGTANALLEAQYLKKPVVVTEGGGSIESVDHGRSGYVTGSDSTMIAGYILEILANKEIAVKMGEIGSDFVAKQYSLQQSINTLVHIMELKNQSV